MVVFPPCKINLGLHVLSKRADGYHNIETCFYPVPRTDILEIVKSDIFGFTQSGLSISGQNEDNLCVKAYQLIKRDFGIGEVKIHLYKMIPMGAGLGGGSSNAAYTLQLLDRIFELNISKDNLKKYAAQLGSDCAFFIDDQPMIGSGRGEVLSSKEINLKGYHLVLITPPIHVSTSEAYAGIIPDQHALSINDILNLPLSQWRDNLSNDFEKTIFKKFPQIEELKKKLYLHEAVYSSMSGSGSSVFGIFKSAIDLKNEFPEIDYWSGELK